MRKSKRAPEKSKSPVDPFKFLNLNNPQQILVETSTEQLQKSHKQLVVCGSIIASVLLLTFLGALFYFKFGLGQSDNTYAYIEVKAIDKTGRTVAGAKVSQNGETIGVTDSFGEWRRYLDVNLGNSLNLTFRKSINGKVWVGYKQIKVPNRLPPKGDLEIFEKVRMNFKSSPSLVTSRKSAPIVSTKPKTLKKPSKVFLTLDGSHSEKVKKDISFIHVKNQIIPFVNKFIKRKSDKTTHGCSRLTAKHIPFAKKKGYVEVLCYDAKGKELWGALRNIEPSKRTTAAKIFQALKSVSRSYQSKRSPVAGWQPYYFAATGAHSKTLRMYVSGFPATRTKDGRYKYWGQERGRVNLAVIEGHTMVYRSRLTNRTGQVRYVSLPGQRVARR